MPDGSLEVVDPALEDLPLLQEIDPDYSIRTAPLQGFTTPGFQEIRRWRVPILKRDLLNIDASMLKELHETEILRVKELERKIYDRFSDDRATLLDLKIEMARRELMSCYLCGRGCGVNRLQGEVGFCGLGVDAYVGGTFIHISEEPPVNPSLLIELHGCGMRCRFCQKPELLVIDKEVILSGTSWLNLDTASARSLSFIGGNPDESLYAILRFLDTAPDDFNLPVVWNCHGYGNIIVYKILEGVVDVYIPDLKYGDDECAATWSGCERYVDTAHTCIAEMARQGVPVIVRMLILPGHSECCHIPSINWLKDYAPSVSLNIMNQYYPDFKITGLNGPMAQRPEAREVQKIITEVEKAGINLII